MSSDLSLTPPSSSPLQPLQVSFDEQEDSSLEDEEDDDLPSFTSPKSKLVLNCSLNCMSLLCYERLDDFLFVTPPPPETLSITKGACVWCKYQRCPFWPAMVIFISPIDFDSYSFLVCFLLSLVIWNGTGLTLACMTCLLLISSSGHVCFPQREESQRRVHRHISFHTEEEGVSIFSNTNNDCRYESVDVSRHHLCWEAVFVCCY